MSPVLILEVVLPIPMIHNLYYLCYKDKKPFVGARVIVPFHNKNILGIIVKIQRHISLDYKKLKEISIILDKQSIFTKNVWELILWCADYYHCSIKAIVFNNLPILFKTIQLKKNCIING